MVCTVVVAVLLCISGQWQRANGQYLLNRTTEMNSALLSAIPLHLNPSYTGQFDGISRVVCYNNSLLSSSGNKGVSVDLPVAIHKDGSYFAAGIQLDRGYTGNVLGKASGQVASASVAYSRHFDSTSRKGLKNSAIALGVQYGQTLMTYTQDYFLNYRYHYQESDTSGYNFQIGANFYKYVNNKFNCTVGCAYRELLDLRGHDYFGEMEFVKMRTATVTLAANYIKNSKITWKPAIYLNTNIRTRSLVYGSDMQIKLWAIDKKNNLSAIAGLWLESSNRGYAASPPLLLNAGLELYGARIGVAKDAGIDRYYSLNQGGWQIVAGYILSRNTLYKKRTLPSKRFG